MLKKTIFLVIMLSIVTFVTYYSYLALSNGLVFGPEKKFVGKLHTPEGDELGSVYVTYLNEKVFTSLVVTKKIDEQEVVLYTINKDGFFNTLGKDGGIIESEFYGYEISSIGEDYFIVHLLTNKGRDVSDDLNIVWNKDQHIFEIQRPNLEKQFISVGELFTKSGKNLGQIFGIPIVGGKEGTFSALYVVEKTNTQAQAVYRISGEGFFNLNGQDKGPIMDGYGGIKVQSIKQDYFIVSLLDQRGDISVSDLIVAWNYQMSLFELQKNK